jgi:hypothetical protein
VQIGAFSLVLQRSLLYMADITVIADIVHYPHLLLCAVYETRKKLALDGGD